MVILIASTIALARFIIIHYYIDWRLLWGGDQIPLFNFNDFASSIFSLSYLWKNLGIAFAPQLSLIFIQCGLVEIISFLTMNRFSIAVYSWVADTLLFFISALLLYYVVASFDIQSLGHKMLMYVFLLLFFTFNPWSTIDTFKSYLGSTSILASLQFIIFSYYLRLLKHLATLRLPSKNEIIAISMIAIILSTTSVSSTIRIGALLFVFGLVLIIYASLYLRIWKWKSRVTIRPFKIFFLTFLPFVIFVISFIIYMILGYYEPLARRVEMKNWRTAGAPSIVESFEAMSIWIASSEYMPYHDIYQRGGIAALMLLWPLISLGLPLLMISISSPSRRGISNTNSLQMIFSLTLALIALAWGTAFNPPFSLVKETLIKIIPLIVVIIPWSSSITVLGFIYIVLASYALSSIMVAGCSKIDHLNRRRGSIRSVAMVILAIALLVTALPIFDGRVFGQYFNSSIKGFNVPNDYWYLKRLKTEYYEHVLLLPQVSTYASTSWGWQGSVSWYHTLNYAILIPNPASYIEYTEWSKIYGELTCSCIQAEGGENLLNYVNLNKLSAWSAIIQYVNSLKNGSINFTLVIPRETDHVDIVMPLVCTLNISNYNVVSIKITFLEPQGLYLRPWFFMYSGNYGGAHILPEVIVPKTVEKTYTVGFPDKPWPSSRYDPSGLSGFMLRINLSKVDNTVFPLKISLVFDAVIISSRAKICSSWVKLLELMNVRYIVIDRTLDMYSKYYELMEGAINDRFPLIYNGSNLKIYEVPVHAQPIHVVSDGNITIEYLEKKPYDILLTLRSQNVSSSILILPIPHFGSLPNPFKVSVENVDGKQFEPIEVNYNGLNGYLVTFPVTGNPLYVKITYRTTYTAVLILYLAYMLLPLVVLTIIALRRIVKALII
jgi:hypothetical protein